MKTSPSANRQHITFFGPTNSGKSSLMNAIVGQEVAIVSPIKGTTTDPVSKPMELIPFGPVVFTDTAGLDDTGDLGRLRVKKTKKILEKTDLAIYVMDATAYDHHAYLDSLNDFAIFGIPYLLVINKQDALDALTLKTLQETYPRAIFLSTTDYAQVLSLKEKMIDLLVAGPKETPIIGDLLPYGSTVVLVVPIDSEAPKGRIILPQVQVIRDALDHGIQCLVVRDTELEAALKIQPKIDLVVTDSQAFHQVDAMVPKSIPLTSFSILYARHKGDLHTLTAGAKFMEQLKGGERVLILESCTHNHSHEDIGRVKIPKGLNQYVGAPLQYTFMMGNDLPEDLSQFDWVIHCGSCMLNRKTMLTRLRLCADAHVPITNYGVVLAALNGILNRATAMM